MRVTRSGRRLACAVLCVAVAAGCAQPTAGRPAADPAAAEQATIDAVKRGIDAFQQHFERLGDEHARVYNYLNYGDVKITTEHESYKVGSTPAILLKRKYKSDGDWSETLTPPKSPVDYIKLDADHAFLAPTPWVSVPSLYGGEFSNNCDLLTAWVACNVEQTIGQTALDVPDKQPSEVRTTDDGTEVITGALLGLMVEEGFISIPEDKREGLTEPMLETVLPIVLRFDEQMSFTGFEIRDTVDDGDATPLQLQLEYEVIGQARSSDIPEPPPADQITVITDKAALDAFWEKFNDRDPSD